MGLRGSSGKQTPRWTIRRFILYGGLLIVVGWIAAHFIEQRRLDEITREILNDRETLTRQIVELCPQPAIATREGVYSAPGGYSYQLRCKTYNRSLSASNREYLISFRKPYGRFSFQRLLGFSRQDYIDGGAWELDPAIARLTEEGQVIWIVWEKGQAIWLDQ